MMSRGVIYATTGAEYAQEAIQSATSLKNSNPSIETVLFTDAPKKNEPFDAVYEIDDPEHTYIDRIHCLLRTPFERTLFLDSDTYVCGDISELFVLLDRFDFAAAHAPVRQAPIMEGAPGGYSISGVPDAFPELNGGVLLYRRSEPVFLFIQDWARRYSDRVAEVGERKNDQPLLRKALYESDINYTVLLPEYNCRYGFATYVEQPVKIVHGRVPPPARVARSINHKLGPRVYVPGVGVIRKNNIFLRVLRRIGTLL